MFWNASGIGVRREIVGGVKVRIRNPNNIAKMNENVRVGDVVRMGSIFLILVGMDA